MLKVPKIVSEKHRRFVASLCCVVPGCFRVPCQCAHVRFSSAAHGKRETGAGTKPGDNWTVPLCPEHHVLGSDAQHTMGERIFWRGVGVDPLVVAALLWANTGDEDAGNRIVALATAFRPTF